MEVTDLVLDVPLLVVRRRVAEADREAVMALDAHEQLGEAHPVMDLPTDAEGIVEHDPARRPADAAEHVLEALRDALGGPPPAMCRSWPSIGRAPDAQLSPSSSALATEVTSLAQSGLYKAFPSPRTHASFPSAGVFQPWKMKPIMAGLPLFASTMASWFAM